MADDNNDHTIDADVGDEPPRRYFQCDALGEGTYGMVRTVYDEDGAAWACKAFAPSEDDDTLSLGTLRELSVLRALDGGRCPWLMRAHDIVAIDGELCLIMPRARCSLAAAIDGGALSNRQKLTIAQRLLTALAFLHANGVMHRDIKCDNVLLDDDYAPWLADFSLAKFVDTDNVVAAEHAPTHTPEIATACYRAPEVYEQRGYGLAADVYALGVVLLELFHGRLEGVVERDKQAIAHVQSLVAKMNDAPLPALLKAMLAAEPRQRPSARSLLESAPAFAKLPSTLEHVRRCTSLRADARSPDEARAYLSALGGDDKKKKAAGAEHGVGGGENGSNGATTTTTAAAAAAAAAATVTATAAAPTAAAPTRAKKAPPKHAQRRRRNAKATKKGDEEREIDVLFDTFELENEATKRAALTIHRRTGEPNLDYCVVLASKMYEPSLLDVSAIDEDYLDGFDAEDYVECEMEMARKLGYCVFV